MTASLWIPGPMPGLNELIDAAKGSGGVGKHYARLKRDWTGVVAGYATRAKMPTFPGRVIFLFHWFEESRRRDPDNVAAGGRKLILDGLVKAGVLKGDGWKFVQAWRDRFDVWSSVPGCRGPGVAVTLEEMSPTVLMD